MTAQELTDLEICEAVARVNRARRTCAAHGGATALRQLASALEAEMAEVRLEIVATRSLATGAVPVPPGGIGGSRR